MLGLQLFAIFIEIGRYGSAGQMLIGMVRHGSENVATQADKFYDCNITYVCYDVDIKEIFQVYRAVQLLDTKYKVDVIVILNDVGVEYTLTKTNATLIKWGKEPPYTIKYHKIVPQAVRNQNTSSELCSKANRETKYEHEPYCFEKEDINEILERTTNQSKMLKQNVDVRGADVLSVLIKDRLQWKSVIIFHESATEMEAGRMVDICSKYRIKVIIFNVETITNLTQILDDSYQRILALNTEINFAVLCSFECVCELLYTANNFDRNNLKTKTLLRQFSRWLVALYNHNVLMSTTLREYAKELDNIAIIAFPQITIKNPEKEFRQLLYSVILEHISNVDVGESGKSLKHVITNKNITNGIIFDLQKKAKNWSQVGKCESFRIDTLTWTNNGRDFTNVGYVSKDGELVVFADLFPNINYGYNRRLFQVSTLHYEPYVIKTVKDGIVSYGGICMELLEELSRTLNFTYNLTEPPDETWGAPQPGEQLIFNGMIGQLQREEVDIVAADISIQKEREMVMDFIFPYYYDYTSVLLKKPDPNAGKWRTLIAPLKLEVWLTIGASLLIVSLVAFFLERFNPFYNKRKNETTEKEICELHTFYDTFRCFSGALLYQGSVKLPRSFAGRTFLSCWWMFGIVVVGTYCGNLVAFLTVTKTKPPFDTLNEMADLKGKYKWGFQEGTHWEHVFKTSTRAEFRRVGDALVEFNETDRSVFSKNFNVQLAKVKSGGYGWIGDIVSMEREMARDCELMMIKDKFLPMKYAFGFTNNSPHVQIFTKQMLSIHESGLIQEWKRRWMAKSTKICADSTIPEAKPITVIDVQSAFYVAAGGGFLSLCAFLIELCVGVLRRRQNKRLPEPQNENLNDIE